MPLILVGTPIGNLGDLSARAAEALAGADVVCCEDTRRTGRLFQLAGIERTARFVRVDDHTEAERVDEVVDRVRRGERVVVVSDAGMPGIADPGERLVAAVAAAGLPVEVVPGPSAAITALVASGLPADEWHFHGFLPRKKGELREVLARASSTLIAFESPRRLPATLALLAEVDPDREAAVCRELTKAHEEIVRGTAAELAERYTSGPPKGEIVLVIAPPASRSANRDAPDLAALDALKNLVDAGAHPRKAATVVASLTGTSANALYRALTSE